MAASASTIGDRRAYIFDAALELRDYDATALSATGSSTAIEFKATKMEYYDCVLDVAAHTGYSAGTALWTITVEASTASGSGFVTIGSYVPDGTAKRVPIPLSGQYVEALKAGATYLRVTATKTGSPGNLTYGAYLSCAC